MASNELKLDVSEEDNETLMSVKINKSHFYGATSYYTLIGDGLAKLESGDKQEINVLIDDHNAVLYTTYGIYQKEVKQIFIYVKISV